MKIIINSILSSVKCFCMYDTFCSQMYDIVHEMQRKGCSKKVLVENGLSDVLLMVLNFFSFC